jgi:hypothetical protein
MTPNVAQAVSQILLTIWILYMSAYLSITMLFLTAHFFCRLKLSHMMELKLVCLFLSWAWSRIIESKAIPHIIRIRGRKFFVMTEHNNKFFSVWFWVK